MPNNALFWGHVIKTGACALAMAMLALATTSTGLFMAGTLSGFWIALSLILPWVDPDRDRPYWFICLISIVADLRFGSVFFVVSAIVGLIFNRHMTNVQVIGLALIALAVDELRSWPAVFRLLRSRRRRNRDS